MYEVYIKLVRDIDTVYVVDEMAKKYGKTVLRLPPYHCELNPIELIWASLKTKVAKRNTTYKIKNLENLVNDELQAVTSDLWKKCIEHVVKIEKSYDLYLNHEKIPVQPVIINLDDSDDSDGSDVSNDASDRDRAREYDSDSKSDVSICL